MMRAEGSHLWRMGHHQHLRILGQSLQPPPHRIRRGPANATVDLVKDHRQAGRPPGQADFHRQQKARKLATRGDLVQRSGRRARVGGDGKGDDVAPVGAALARRDLGGKQRSFHF